MIINKKKKKRTYKIVDFAVPADHRIKLKGHEKKSPGDLRRLAVTQTPVKNYRPTLM